MAGQRWQGVVTGKQLGLITLSLLHIHFASLFLLCVYVK